MSLLDGPILPTAPTAPHERVQYILYTAPYIKHLFDSFLTNYTESTLLESDAFVHTLSTLYVLGLKKAPNFWKETPEAALLDDDKAILEALTFLRRVRSKCQGKRPWENLLEVCKLFVIDLLPTRKNRRSIVFDGLTEEETTVQIRLLHLAMLVSAHQPCSQETVTTPAVTRPRANRRIVRQ